MASESSSERTVSITLPGELDDWLDEQAATAELDREELLLQLLSSYRQAIEHEDETDVSVVVDEDIERSIQDAVDEQVSETLDDRLAAELDRRLDDQLRSEVAGIVEDILTEQVTEATNSVQRQLSNRIDTIEDDFQSKIEDVRERVIQVKTETDSKAPADHHHEAFETLDGVSKQVSKMEAELATLREEFDDTVPGHEETLSEMSGTVENLQERLQTVAWVVSDLREAHESSGGLEAVERIKRAAAKANIERATCENCGDTVAISLLTDPKCPHCDATVSNVEAAAGWFGKPTLLTASQLESGEGS